MDKNKAYNIFGALSDDISDFDTKGHYIIGKPSASDEFDKNSRGRDGGYYYTQKETLEAIDLAAASKFKEGYMDSEKKRKTYMNIVNFHKDVALNQINVNVANYILEPTDDMYSWITLFTDKRFKEFADENSYDDQIDEFADDFAGHGSVVAKKVRGNSVRIPLRTLKNTQTARSLKEAAFQGGYVIIENELHYTNMTEFPDWKLEGLDKTKSYQFYERYTLVPRSELVKFQGGTPTDDDFETMICCLQILLPDVATQDNDREKAGKILFIEQISEDDWLFEEAHYTRIDGRWLGRGEIEKQLENQISTNLNANLRRRSLLWHARKIFQSIDDEVKRNLMMEVKDGEVLKIKKGGEVSQVNVGSQGTGDFNADSQETKDNSQKISFTFEAATGESMPSGTPVRLGVILENAVSKYFKRKQDTFSNFLKRSFFNQIMPTFISENSDEHSIAYGVMDANYDLVKDALVTIKANERVHSAWEKKQWLTFDEAKLQVENELARNPVIFVKMLKDSYKDPHCVMRLNINEPIAGDIESLTTVWQGLQAKGDPRADRVLKLILAKRGQNLDYILGPMQQAPAAAQPTGSAPGGNIPPTDKEVTPGIGNIVPANA